MLYLYSRCIDDTLLCSIFGEDAQRDLPESMDSLDEEDQDRFYQGVFDAHRHDSEARRICDSYRDQVYRDLHKELKTQRGQLRALLE